MPTADSEGYGRDEVPAENPQESRSLNLRPCRPVPAAWEVSREGMIRLDGCPIGVHQGAARIVIRDKSRPRAQRRGSEFIEGDLLELVRELSKR